MSITIIKKGNKYEKTCDCGTIFSFDYSDLKAGYLMGNWIRCPYCKKHILINEKDMRNKPSKDIVIK